MTALVALQARFLRDVAARGTPGLAVYRDSIAAGHRDALLGAFPVVERLVGPAFFAEAARHYAERFPSRSGDLHRYGERFAVFLSGYAPAGALEYLADVARLEWARHRAALADDVPAFDVAALAALPEERHGELVLRLHPAVTLIESAFAIERLWEANQPGGDGRLGDVHGACRLRVWRDGDLAVRHAAVDAVQWDLLQACARGVTLGAALDGLGEGAEAAVACIGVLAREGVFARCEIP